MEWYKSPKFKRLQAKWYNKIRKSCRCSKKTLELYNCQCGSYEDIEHDEDHLKLSSDRFVVRNDGAYANPILTSAKADYYSACRKFLNSHTFKSKKEKTMWEMHSEGISIRDIASKYKVSRRYVHELIKRLVKEVFK